MTQFPTPTLFDLTCDGIGSLQTRTAICVHKDAFSFAHGSRAEAWPQCVNEESPFDCVCGTVCSTSACTYGASGGVIGLDFVAETFLPEYLHRRERFAAGVGLNASFWNATDALVSNLCGGYNSNVALRFSGRKRSVVTVDFDLSSGGLLQFYLRIGNLDNIACAAALVGSVTVAYSVDYGVTWADVTTFYVSDYKGNDFKRARAALQESGWSSHTRFKIYQKAFLPAMDHVAIGDIQVFKTLPLGGPRTRTRALPLFVLPPRAPLPPPLPAPLVPGAHRLAHWPCVDPICVGSAASSS